MDVAVSNFFMLQDRQNHLVYFDGKVYTCQIIPSSLHFHFPLLNSYQIKLSLMPELHHRLGRVPRRKHCSCYRSRTFAHGVAVAVAAGDVDGSARRHHHRLTWMPMLPSIGMHCWTPPVWLTVSAVDVPVHVSHGSNYRCIIL